MRRFQAIRHLLICLFVLPSSAWATLITVNTLDDTADSSGNCSLREAVQAANQNTAVDGCPAGGNAPADTIFIGVSGTITLSAALQFTERVVVLGPGRDSLTISGQKSTSLFIVNLPNNTHDFELKLMTLSDGAESVPGSALWLQDGGSFLIENVRFKDNTVFGSGNFGGALGISIEGSPADTATVAIRRCTFEGNSAARGGAIGVDGGTGLVDLDSFNIDESHFESNSAEDGGAIWMDNIEASEIERSVFVNNMATEQGGAIYQANDNHTLSISRSTFSENTASSGGALYLRDGTSRIENSTFSSNQGGAFGNAVRIGFEGLVSVRFSTFVDNDTQNTSSSVFSLRHDTSRLELGHSIVWSETAADSDECDIDIGASGVVTSVGYNIDSSGTCTSESTDLPATDPAIAQLGDYGDDSSWITLQTFLPLPGSPAIDGGPSNCTSDTGSILAADQRAEPRPSDGDGDGSARCDIGAVEIQPADNPLIFSDRFEGSP